MRPANVLGRTGSSQHQTSSTTCLVGGLAAMFCLVAGALLILACSYRKVRAGLWASSEEKGVETTVEAGTEKLPVDVVVIMAGEEKPTFLAKPQLSVTNPSCP